jgi:hypothetical protein
MHSFTKFLYDWLLPIALKNTCFNKFPHDRIPRSGEEGKKVHCYLVSTKNPDGSNSIVKDYKNGTLTLYTLKDKSTQEINISKIFINSISIEHFYSYYDIEFKNIYDFAFNYITKFIYIKINTNKLTNVLSQYFFNKNTLIAKNKIEILRYLLEIQYNNNNHLSISKGIDIISLSTKIHSIRLLNHPNKDILLNKIRLCLDALIYSEDIVNNDSHYLATGKAITTIENFDREERRHNDLKKLQRRTISLTFILIIVGLIQAQVIKIPTILDLSEIFNKFFP